MKIKMNRFSACATFVAVLAGLSVVSEGHKEQGGLRKTTTTKKRVYHHCIHDEMEEEMWRKNIRRPKTFQKYRGNARNRTSASRGRKLEESDMQNIRMKQDTRWIDNPEYVPQTVDLLHTLNCYLSHIFQDG